MAGLLLLFNTDMLSCIQNTFSDLEWQIGSKYAIPDRKIVKNRLFPH